MSPLSPLLDDYDLVWLTMGHLVTASNGGIVDLSASSPLWGKLERQRNDKGDLK